MMINLLAVWWFDRMRRKKVIGYGLVVFCLLAQGIALISGLFMQASIYRVPPIPDNGAQLKHDLLSDGLPRDGAPPRVALPVSILSANAGAQLGLSTISGFNNPALGRTWDALYCIAGQPAPDFHRAEVKDGIVLKLNDRPDYFGLSTVIRMPGNRIYFAPPTTPRAFVAFTTSRVQSSKEAFAKIREGHDFIRDVLVEQPLPFHQASEPTVAGNAEIVGFSRNCVVVKYTATAPALLVLAEAWYPGWTATINKRVPVETIPVNGWMRGVPVPAGSAQVAFNYRPTRWWRSLLVSFISFLLAWYLWTRPKSIEAGCITP